MSAPMSTKGNTPDTISDCLLVLRYKLAYSLIRLAVHLRFSKPKGGYRFDTVMLATGRSIKSGITADFLPVPARSLKIVMSASAWSVKTGGDA